MDTRASRSVLLILLCLSFDSFVHPLVKQDLRIGSSAFSDFCMKLDSQIRKIKNKKIDEAQFLKKNPRQVKRAQNVPKTRFLMFWQKYKPYVLGYILLEYASTNGLLTFCKNHMFGKNLVLGLKTSKPISMLDSLNYNISQTSWSMKLRFYMWLDIRRSNKFTQVGVVRYVYACPELWHIVSQLHLRKGLSYAVVSLHVVRDP